MVSFSLISRYKIAEELLSLNIILGTGLFWNIVMAEIDLYTKYSNTKTTNSLAWYIPFSIETIKLTFFNDQ